MDAMFRGSNQPLAKLSLRAKTVASSLQAQVCMYHEVWPRQKAVPGQTLVSKRSLSVQKSPFGCWVESINADCFTNKYYVSNYILMMDTKL